MCCVDAQCLVHKLIIGRMRTPAREAFSYGIQHGIRHIHCDSMKYDLMLSLNHNEYAVSRAVSQMKMPPVREYASSLIPYHVSLIKVTITRPSVVLLVPTKLNIISAVKFPVIHNKNISFWYQNLKKFGKYKIEIDQSRLF